MFLRKALEKLCLHGFLMQVSQHLPLPMRNSTLFQAQNQVRFMRGRMACCIHLD
jgi:hypothetical protein